MDIKLKKRGYFVETLSRFGVERDQHRKDRVGMLRSLSQREGRAWGSETGGVGYARVGEWAVLSEISCFPWEEEGSIAVQNDGSGGRCQGFNKQKEK